MTTTVEIVYCSTLRDGVSSDNDGRYLIECLRDIRLHLPETLRYIKRHNIGYVLGVTVCPEFAEGESWSQGVGKDWARIFTILCLCSNQALSRTSCYRLAIPVP